MLVCNLSDFEQVSDPDDETIFEEKISIGGKIKELEHKVEKRGVYQMCYELFDGKHFFLR